jgi:hypothetical protein
LPLLEDVEGGEQKQNELISKKGPREIEKYEL